MLTKWIRTPGSRELPRAESVRIPSVVQVRSRILTGPRTIPSYLEQRRRHWTQQSNQLSS